MSKKKNKAEEWTQEKILEILDSIYQKASNGLSNVVPPIEQFAADYTSKYPTVEIAAKKMINVQVSKCTTAGFITGFGGIITLPVAVPADIGSVLFVQMRMIACAAYMAGFDVHSDEVQTLVYACLAGVSITEVLKQAGIQFGEKLAVVLIKKIPAEVLTKINQKVGFRLFTKFGEKGIINFGKMVPVVGAIINGGFDFAETKVIGNRAYNAFIKGDYSVFDEAKSQSNIENIIDAECDEIIDDVPHNNYNE